MNKRIKANEKHIQGLRKLQQILNSRTENQSQASQTVALKSTGSLEPAVATPTASATPISVTVTNNQGMSPTPEASATSHDRTGKENQALSTKKGVSVKVDTATSSVSASLQKEPPQSLSFCTQFSAVSVKNTFQPLIYDFKLLPGGLLISADFRNYCVDLFNMQGKHLQRHVFVDNPRRLAVMDPDSEERWMVAVTLPDMKAVILLQIKSDSITQMNTIQMAYRCWAVAAVDDSTLAVGYEQREGITIMNISGCIIRQIGLNLIPYHMTATQDKCLLMSTRYNKITKIKVKDGTVIFDRAVPQIGDSSGNAALQNGWSVFSNCITNSVHLVTPNGHWARELWRQCSDQKFGAFLCTVCVDDGIYVTGFTNGTFCQLVDLT
ncbi:hypothetical protein RRG08_015100 [Elysia crispata]|uniref:Uncharacterized protein n=1 Tax=Elysia crispata TaxID=231223 RepID=A0AAE1B5B8_9GAST|nr:hypothetical protein RRG08_015100 [Elysia crispata]